MFASTSDKDMFGGRRPLIRLEVGSHNSNLNDKDSDHDYDYFVAPTLRDLYEGNKYTKNTASEGMDWTAYDIRRMPELLWKSNPAMVEAMFSKDRTIHADGKVKELIEGIFDRSEDIARMNLPYLWNASMGMVRSWMGHMNGDSRYTREYGYDTKKVMHAVRVLDILHIYQAGGFASFERAMRFEGEEREYLLNIKHGMYTKEEAERFVSAYIDRIEGYRDLYTQSKPDRETYEWLDSTVMEIVRICATNDLEKGMD